MRIRQIITEAPQLGLPEFQGLLSDGEHVAAWAREHEKQLKGFIQAHCGRWMAESQSRPAWRGFKSASEAPAFVRPIRKDRRPRDSDLEQNRWLNALLTIARSPATRQNSLFVTGNIDEAANYGHVHRVFLMGDFHYAWMPGEVDWGEMAGRNGQRSILDLIDPERVVGSMAYEDLLNDDALEPMIRDMLPDLDPDEAVETIWHEAGSLIEWLDPDFLDPYQVRKAIQVDRGLAKAISTGVELMVTGEQAFSLDWHAANAIGLGE